jgi:SHS2 domain-containing protein
MGALLRRHRVVGHTADVGLEASAPELSALFEEAAAALAEIAADAGPDRAGGTEAIELEADDLEALAYAWLNELIGLAQSRGQALTATDVAAVERTHEGGWRISASARFAPFAIRGSDGARARVDVKSATYHRLTVRRDPDGWMMTAYLDV